MTTKTRNGLTRRTAMKGAAAMALGGVGASTLSRMGAAEDAPPELREGGELQIAIMAEPPAVADAVFTTATITNDISQQIFEGLFAFDQSFAPQPMLVEDYDVADDGTSYRFKLRSGVTFHNGDSLTANDVVASLNRWGAINGRGRMIFDRMDSIDAVDELTVSMTFNQPTGVLLSCLSLPEAMITPASVAEAAGEMAIPEESLIGTGPFRFVEHVVDQRLRLGRNDDYVSRDEAPDGLSGAKRPWLDALDFIPVPDESVRANGLMTGEYHFSEQIPADFYDSMELDPALVPVIVKPYFSTLVHFNKAAGLFQNQSLRKAVQLCFSQSEAMLAGFGREEFMRADPSISGEETVWYSVAGADAYDQPDQEKAKALLEEGGYNGETIRWMTTHEYDYNFKMADFIKQRMEQIGMKVQLDVYDWATVIQNQPKTDVYEIFLTGHPQYKHPALQVFNDPTFGGFWDSSDKDALVDQMILATGAEQLQTAIDDYTSLIWEEMPFVKCGDYFVLRGHRDDVVGYVNVPNFFFWNVGLK